MFNFDPNQALQHAVANFRNRSPQDQQHIINQLRAMNINTAPLESILNQNNPNVNNNASNISPTDFISAILGNNQQKVQNQRSNPMEIPLEEQRAIYVTDLEQKTANFQNLLMRAVSAKNNKQNGINDPAIERDFASLGELMADYVITAEQIQKINVAIAEKNKYSPPVQKNPQVSAVPQIPQIPQIPVAPIQPETIETTVKPNIETQKTTENQKPNYQQNQVKK